MITSCGDHFFLNICHSQASSYLTLGPKPTQNKELPAEGPVDGTQRLEISFTPDSKHASKQADIKHALVHENAYQNFPKIYIINCSHCLT